MLGVSSYLRLETLDGCAGGISRIIQSPVFDLPQLETQNPSHTYCLFLTLQDTHFLELSDLLLIHFGIVLQRKKIESWC